MGISVSDLQRLGNLHPTSGALMPNGMMRRLDTDRGYIMQIRRDAENIASLYVSIRLAAP
jgi:hypothetical protein